LFLPSKLFHHPNYMWKNTDTDQLRNGKLSEIRRITLSFIGRPGKLAFFILWIWKLLCDNFRANNIPNSLGVD
jgi:hypothetical protein